MYTIMNVYAIRMAGVFMISLGTIWIQTRVVPRLFVFFTYALALLLLVTINFSLWMILIFPVWVFVISVIFCARLGAVRPPKPRGWSERAMGNDHAAKGQQPSRINLPQNKKD